MVQRELLEVEQNSINQFIGNATPVLVNFTYERGDPSRVIIQAVWTKEGDNLKGELNVECLDRLEAACFEYVEG